MRIGSLFSGIGGLELGLEWSGLGSTVWQCESDPYCRKILSRHWPEAILYDDVRTLDPAALPAVDLICGGFPCQDVSAAGKGAGLGGSRSGLWYEFARVLEGCQPQWVVVENVASGASRWVDAVRGDLERIGYATLPVPLSAVLVGAPHRRNRIFLVGCLGNSSEPRLEERSPKPHPDKLEAAERAGWWELEPDVGRVVARVSARLDAHRRDRLRALGNAVVPQCAEVIGWMIRDLEPG